MSMHKNKRLSIIKFDKAKLYEILMSMVYMYMLLAVKDIMVIWTEKKQRICWIFNLGP